MSKLVKLALSLIVVGLVGVVVLIMTGNGRQDVNIKKSVNAQNVDQLAVEGDLVDVNIHPSTKDQVQMKLSGKRYIGSNVDLQTSKTNGLVRVDVRQKEMIPFVQFGFIYNGMKPLQLDMYLPEKQYQSLTFKTDSSIDVDQKLSAKELTVEANNGDINLNGYKGNQLNAKSDFGDISLQRIDAPLDVITNNGDVKLTSTNGFKGNNRIKSDFGDVSIRTPRKPTSLKVDFQTDFGDIQTDYPITGGKNLKDDFAESQVKGIIGKEKSDGQGSTLTIQTDNGDISLKK
ncbi:DUF4097 and DUF4098 domain-containing protein YvlB [Marininema mesophilum]|uniref:DUF4097 and DUF4098 domain-containing protein YvlB n=1 Tax=Marininema mesophilum TaxID=1048340 RepID=A0A1H2ZKV3_9BACL|nr:DUF4097 family beta strand repeat-containing protein [Marininema mesophilum]SDX17987.1 DUF4097 and DUF4098 domain-containing protein YvlB [Marininema mesophilum]